MVELSLIFSLAVLAAVAAISLARWSVSHAEGSAEAARVVGAVRRAGGDFAWRQSKRGVAVAAGLGVVYSLVALFHGEGAGQSVKLTLLGGIVLGAVACQASGQLAIAIAPRASAHVATAMVRATQTHGMAVGLKASAAIGLAAHALSLVACSAPLLILPLGTFEDFKSHAPLLACGVALGSVASALWSQVTGGALHYAGQVGRRQPQLTPLAERFEVNAKNPTLILDLVGNHVGVSATRCQDAFCTSSLLHAGALSLGLWVWDTGGGAAPPVAVFAFPGLLHAFGLVAATVAIFSSRADESDEPKGVLWRGHLATTLLCVASLAGLSVWLFGELWLPWFSAGLVGLLFGALLVFTRQALVDRRLPELKAHREASGLSPGLHVGRGIAHGIAASWPGLLSIGGVVFVVASLARDSQSPLGVPLSVTIGLWGLAMALPYATVLALFDPIADGGCALATLDPRRRPDLHSKAVRLEQAALSAGSAGRGHLLVLGGALGVVVTLQLTHGAAGIQDWGLPATPSLAWAGALVGVLVALLFSGAALRHIALVASQTALDVQRQLQGFARDARGLTELPEDFRPRYADHLSAACSRALSSRALIAQGALLSIPALLLLQNLISSSPASSQVIVLVWFLAFAAGANLVLGLGAEATWGVLSSTRRHTHPKEAGQLSTVNLADGLGEFAGNALSPTLALVAKALLAAGLASTLILL